MCSTDGRSDTSRYRHNWRSQRSNVPHPVLMQTYWYEEGTSVLVFDEPRPEPEPGRYLGSLDMGAGELDLLRVIVNEYRVDGRA